MTAFSDKAFSGTSGISPAVRSIILSLGPSRHTQILCFYTGAAPARAYPMELEPLPPSGMDFDETFPHVIERALELNFAAHDGAVLIGRKRAAAPYAVVGWSYRLAPPRARRTAAPNRGSAYNSCVAMSSQRGVDFLVLRTATTLEVFQSYVGREGRAF
jgi:hypothetical protein